MRLAEPPQTSGTARRSFDDQLAIIEALLAAHDDSIARSRAGAATIYLLLVLLSVRVAATFLAWMSGHPIAPGLAPLGVATHACLFLGFGAAGIGLLVAGRHDRRARALAGAFMVVALAFAREPLRTSSAGLAFPWSALLTLQWDPLMPLFLALFARDFPRGNRFHLRRASGILVAAAAVTGGAQLLAALFFSAVENGAVNHHPLVEALLIMDADSTSGVTFGLSALALFVLFLRSRQATGWDAVRAQWFALGLILGLTPLTIDVLLAATVQPFRAWSEGAGVTPFVALVIAGALLTIPMTTAYAVMSRSVLQVSVAFRRATGCALTKYLAVAASILPAVLVIAKAIRYRDMTVSSLFGGPSDAALLALAALGLAALPFTSTILRRIERAFFPHSWDQERAVARLRSDLSAAANIEAIGDLTRTELEAALGVRRIRVAMLDSDGGHYLDVESMDLACPSASAMLELITRAESPVLALTDPVLRILDTREAAWLASVAAEAVAGIKTTDGRIVGVFAIGARESELPYSEDDERAIVALTTLASDAIERLRYHRVASGAVQRIAPGPQALAASECPDCGVVYDEAYRGLCRECGASLRRSCVPTLVSGKFRVDRRVGKGGMGVVYAAFDASLQRWVAVKALAYISEAAEQRLTREAQLMANVSHPNVATVFGLESWNERPLMIVEYLHGGTLRDVIRRGPCDVAPVTEWGLALADGLHYLHRHGLVHGDIKPSNIGFDGQGIPKLLDFGLSQSHSGPERSPRTRSSIPFGTPSYLCPEAAGAETPRPEFDLWSLALVLYETIAGHAFMVERGQSIGVPPLSQFTPDVPKTLDDFFSRALSLRPDLRPRSAAEFALWLRRARPI